MKIYTSITESSQLVSVALDEQKTMTAFDMQIKLGLLVTNCFDGVLMR